MFLCLDEYGLLIRKTAINHIRVVSENRVIEASDFLRVRGYSK